MLKRLCWAPLLLKSCDLATVAMSRAGAVWKLPCSAAAVQQWPRWPDSSTGPAKPSSGCDRTPSRAVAATARYQCYMVLPGPSSRCPCTATATSSCCSVSIRTFQGPGYCKQWRDCPDFCGMSAFPACAVSLAVGLLLPYIFAKVAGVVDAKGMRCICHGMKHILICLRL